MVKYIEDQNLYFFKYTESCALWYISSCKYFQLVIVFSVKTTDEGINNTEIYDYMENILCS